MIADAILSRSNESTQKTARFIKETDICEQKMNTRELARQLNAVEVVSVERLLGESTTTTKQVFDYLLVLDFEATCWDSPKPPPSEIIEFPVVLFDVEKNQIVEEFQQYVKPVEHPKLSDFCSKLTGIHQSQVDEGVLLQTCLNLFSNWLDRVLKKYNMEFYKVEGSQGKKKCIFTTWSDWDLGTCLKKEWRRKGLVIKSIYSEIFLKWIDLRAVYKKNYRRPLNGLRGALAEVGLQFEGNEHCGLHDARNTAKLAGKMIAGGIILECSN